MTTEKSTAQPSTWYTMEELFGTQTLQDSLAQFGRNQAEKDLDFHLKWMEGHKVDALLGSNIPNPVQDSQAAVATGMYTSQLEFRPTTHLEYELIYPLGKEHASLGLQFLLKLPPEIDLIGERVPSLQTSEHQKYGYALVLQADQLYVCVGFASRFKVSDDFSVDSPGVAMISELIGKTPEAYLQEIKAADLPFTVLFSAFESFKPNQISTMHKHLGIQYVDINPDPDNIFAPDPRSQLVVPGTYDKVKDIRLALVDVEISEQDLATLVQA